MIIILQICYLLCCYRPLLHGPFFYPDFCGLITFSQTCLAFVTWIVAFVVTCFVAFVVTCFVVTLCGGRGHGQICW